MAVMISINPPYSTMIMSGHKWLEFRNKIIKTIQGYPDGTSVYIYETKNKKGCGQIIGEATIFNIYQLGYGKHDDTTERVIERFSAIKQLYLDWCTKCNVKPNMNEGWFKSKRFTAYKNEIGWGGNYALHLDNIIKYETPKTLSDFVNARGEMLQRPPQNMFNCELNAVMKEGLQHGI